MRNLNLTYKDTQYYQLTVKFHYRYVYLNIGRSIPEEEEEEEEIEREGAEEEEQQQLIQFNTFNL